MSVGWISTLSPSTSFEWRWCEPVSCDGCAFRSGGASLRWPGPIWCEYLMEINTTPEKHYKISITSTRDETRPSSSKQTSLQFYLLVNKTASQVSTYCRSKYTWYLRKKQTTFIIVFDWVGHTEWRQHSMHISAQHVVVWWLMGGGCGWMACQFTLPRKIDRWLSNMGIQR